MTNQQTEYIGAATPAPRTLAPAQSVEPLAMPPGDCPEVAGYTVLRLLGRGGMGTVYEADQHDPPRRVALKVVSGRLDAEAAARFAIERQAIARMQHPNVARVFESGVTADRVPFYAMEMVDGLPLNEYCDSHHLPVRDRLGVFVQVCRAVQHAHQKGVIHRDLKPSNILVAEADGQAVPKVIDFGLAKLTSDVDERMTMTLAGAVAGTPLYMAPEQANPFARTHADTRTDVYALGVILYELLTGRTPLTADDLRGLEHTQLLERVRVFVPRRPSTVADPRLTGVMRGELDWIALKCLAKEPERRYQTTDQLADDVERFLTDQPVLARPPSRWYAVGKFVKRNRAPVAVAAVLLLSLILGAVGTTTGLVRAEALRADAERQRQLVEEQRLAADELRLAAEEQRRVAMELKELAERRAEAEAAARKDATTARERADREALTAETTLGFMLYELIAPIDPSFLIPGHNGPNKDVTLSKVLDRAAARVDGGLSLQPAVRIRLREVLCLAYLSLGRTPEAEAQAARLEKEFDRPLDPADAKQRKLALTLARTYAMAGKPQRAEPVYREAARAVLRDEGEHSPSLRQINHDLANCLVTLGKFDEAERLMTALLAGAGPNPADRLSLTSNLAAVYTQLGRFDRVVGLLEGFVSDKPMNGADELALAAARGCLARAYHELYRFDDARPLAAAVVDTYRRKHGPNHLLTIGAVGELAAVETESGRHAAAEKLFDDVIPRMNQEHGASHPFLFVLLGNQAMLYERMKEWEKAERVHRDRIGVCGKAYGKNSPYTADAEIDLAFVLDHRDAWAESEPLIRHSLTVYEQVAPESWQAVKARLLLASTVDNLGRPGDEGERLLLSCAEWATRRPKSGPPPALDQIQVVLQTVAGFYRMRDNKGEEAKWLAELSKRQPREVLPPPRLVK